MKEFAKGGSTAQEQIFGYRLSSALIVVECTFGRLKARFGIIQVLWTSVWTIYQKRFMHVSFNLHNFCEMHNETIHKISLDSDHDTLL